MKKQIFCMLSLLPNILFAANASVYVSFSMPRPLLIQTLNDAARCHIPAYLNGLHHNSMSDTAFEVMALVKEVPDLNLQIDPTAFERFGIHKVPALVVSEGEERFDVIYGHLPLKESLERIANHGAAGLFIPNIRQLCNE